MAQVLNFDLVNNEDWDAVFLLKDKNDVVVPIGGTKVHLQIRSRADDTNVAFEASIDNGYFKLTDENTSEITLNVRGSKMRSIPAGSYVYDLIVENPSGRVTRCYEGTITIDQGVTELVLQPST